MIPWYELWEKNICYLNSKRSENCNINNRLYQICSISSVLDIVLGIGVTEVIIT